MIVNHLSLFLLVFLSGSRTIHAQTPARIIKDSLYSNVLRQERQIEILLPPGGIKEGTHYEVFYVLDGEWNTDLNREIMDFLVGEGMMPPQILVSVLNGEPNMRDRDFTPTHVPDNSLSGGADNFIDFLRNELRPYIDRKYPVSGKNTLFGHSFGGLFGMYALLKSPGLFDSYMLGDPSFWWDNHYIYPLLVAALKQPGRPMPALFVLGRKGDFEDSTIKLDAAGMDSVVRTVGAMPSNWKIVTSAGETHNSTKLRTLTEGMRFIYKGYIGKPLYVNPTSGGIIVEGRPFTFYSYDNYIEPFHYTLNGEVPTENSKALAWRENFTFDHSTDLTITSQTIRPDLAQTIREHFEIGETIKAEAKPNARWLRDSSFSLSKLRADSNGWKKFSAYLEIKQAGYYLMQALGANGIHWYVQNKQVMFSDTAAKNGNYQSVIVPLEKGYYALRIEVRSQTPAKDAVLLYNPDSNGNGLSLLPDLLYLQSGKH
jgi:predicted alpha/beta superfamily hydrolase